MFGALLRWLTGGVLDRVLKSVDHAVSNETKREEIKADLIARHLSIQAEQRMAAMQSRVFWAVWALFAVPLGSWWALVLLDTMFAFSWSVPDLPGSVRPWANVIFESVFWSGGGVAGAQVLARAVAGMRR